MKLTAIRALRWFLKTKLIMGATNAIEHILDYPKKIFKYQIFFPEDTIQISPKN